MILSRRDTIRAIECLSIMQRTLIKSREGSRGREGVFLSPPPLIKIYNIGSTSLVIAEKVIPSLEYYL